MKVYIHLSPLAVNSMREDTNSVGTVNLPRVWLNGLYLLEPKNTLLSLTPKRSKIPPWSYNLSNPPH